MARILVAGAGAIGASVAYHLALRGARDVVLCDRAEIAGGATGKAMGGFRQQFSTAAEVRLAQASHALFAELGAPLFEQVGYMFVATTSDGLERLAERAVLQQSLGVPVEEVDAGRVPRLRIDDVLGAYACWDNPEQRCVNYVWLASAPTGHPLAQGGGGNDGPGGHLRAGCTLDGEAGPAVVRHSVAVAREVAGALGTGAELADTPDDPRATDQLQLVHAVRGDLLEPAQIQLQTVALFEVRERAANRGQGGGPGHGILPGEPGLTGHRQSPDHDPHDEEGQHGCQQ